MVPKGRTRQGVAVVLFLLWLGCVVYALIIDTVGVVTYTPFIETKEVEPPNPQIPPIKCDIVYTLSAKGSFSAENPITITVNVTNANITDLLDYYKCVGFFDSVFATQEPQYTPLGVEVPGYVPLTRQPNGTYIGTATLKWHVESDVYSFMVPQPKYSPFNMKVGPSSDEMPIIHVSPSSDTFNWRFSETTTRLTFVFLGFSFLMLQPIFEAILRLKEN